MHDTEPTRPVPRAAKRKPRMAMPATGGAAPAPRQHMTAKDVARLAGVVQSTVSRVLNGADNVAPELHARVLKAVQALNYQPLQAARALALERHETIGVMVDETLLDAFYGASLLSGASLAAADRGWHVMICAVPANATPHTCDALPVFRTRAVDGVILDVLPAADVIETMLVRARIPFVSVNPSREHVTNAIALDDVAVACRATQYLIARGHTRIAYVPFQSLSHRSQLERMQGYTSALTQAGLAPLPYWDQPLPLPAEQPAELCRRLQCWRTQHDCSALVVYNGTLAPRVLCACYTRGVHIPQDLSVICCDASPVYGLLPQMFTHIALERIEIGRRAVAMLEQRLATHADVPAVVLHGELREGATVACLARDSLTSPTPSTI